MVGAAVSRVSPCTHSVTALHTRGVVEVGTATSYVTPGLQGSPVGTLFADSECRTIPWLLSFGVHTSSSAHRPGTHRQRLQPAVVSPEIVGIVHPQCPPPKMSSFWSSSVRSTRPAGIYPDVTNLLPRLTASPVPRRLMIAWPSELPPPVQSLATP